MRTFCLFLCAVSLAGCGLVQAQSTQLQTFYVTDAHDGWNAIKVRAKDRLWAEMIALNATVWTEQEWRKLEKESVTTAITFQDGSPFPKPTVLDQKDVYSRYLRTAEMAIPHEGDCYQFKGGLLHKMECKP